MQVTSGKLKKHLASKNLLPLPRNFDLHRLADEIAVWFDHHARDLPPLVQIDLLYRFAYEEEIKFDGHDHKTQLRWLIALVGRLVQCNLLHKGWPPPIHFRMKTIRKGHENRLGDYVLLYEALIHFHFVMVASQFFWMTRDLEVAGLPPSVVLGHKILVAALTDKKCMGGGVWLQRAGGISRAGHDFIKQADGACVAPLPELFDILEPEALILHPAFGTNPHQAEIVRSSSPTFRLFKLLQLVRNNLVAHDEDLGCDVETEVFRGLLVLFGVLSQRMAIYQQFGLALTSQPEHQVILQAQWDSDGEPIQPDNLAVRPDFISTWGEPLEPEAPFAAPDIPSIEGWSWEDSLLLFDRAAPRTRYLYLMPMGCRYEHADGSGELLPGLLDSVIWRKIGKTRRTSLTIVQRKYRNKSELASDWYDTQSHQPVRPGPAHENIRTLVEKIRATYHLDFELPEEEAEVVTRVFDLGHGPHALRLAETTVPRAGEVERILGRARDLAACNTAGCARLLLIGPSGIGKSVLMAQMYARVQPRALFFTMDHAPEPEFELAPASRETALSPVVRSSDGAPSIQAPSPSLGGEGRERGLGVPVRMHWLAGARRLVGKPVPTFMLDAEEVQRQIAALLEEASASAPEPVYLFIDAVNQTAAPESLLQGFRPFSRLPRNVVIIASTQDNAEVLARLTDNGRQPWEPFPAEALVLEQTRSILLWNWPSESPPSPSDALIRFVQSQSGGLPLLVRFWGERFAILWQENPVTAESRLQAELAKGGAALLPRNYFDDRLEKASHDFVPKRLPEALLWCFSLISKPLGTDGLTRAIAGVRGHFGLPPVSKANVDGAITRLSGLLVADHFGFDRLWRLAHPIIGAAYLDYFGTPDRIATINETLLPFGAIPQVEAWNTDQRIAWLERLFGRATEYSELETEQKRVLVTGLLAQLESDSGLQGLRHRRVALMAEHGWLLHQLKRSEEGFSLAEQALAWGRERLLDPELSDALRADLQWDAGTAIAAMGIIEWPQGLRAPLVARFEETLALRESARSYTPGWTDDRARSLAFSHWNLALALNLVGKRDEAISHYESAIHILKCLDLIDARVRTDLASTYCNRGWVRQALGQHVAALEDFDHAIELYRTFDLSKPEYSFELAKLYEGSGHMRAILGQQEAALADYDRAIDLVKVLDLNIARYTLVVIYDGRGRAWGIAHPTAALDNFDRAIELGEGLDLSVPAHCQELVRLYSMRGSLRCSLSDQMEAALADSDRAIELGERLNLSDPEDRYLLSQSYGLRSILMRFFLQMEAALADSDRAIELAKPLHLNRDEYRDRLAQAHFERGDVHNILGQMEAARTDYDRAIELGEGVGLERAKYRQKLIIYYSHRGIAHGAMGQREMALADYDRAIELGERVDLSNAMCCNDLAKSHYNRAIIRNDMGQREMALADYDRAIALGERLDLCNAEYHRNLAAYHTNRGYVRDRMGHREIVLADYDRAIALYEELDLGNAEYRHNLALVHANRVSVRNALGHREAALADCERAIALYEGLDLGNAEYRAGLARAFSNCGYMRDALGHREAALADCERAIALYEGLDLGNAKYRAGLAHAFNNCGTTRAALGQQEAALADYDRAVNLCESLDLADPENRKDLAEVYESRGKTHEALGHQEAAQADFNQADQLRVGLDPAK